MGHEQVLPGSVCAPGAETRSGPDANDPDHDLSSYRFDLPEGLIAQEPLADREGSRLMVLSRQSGATVSGWFTDLPLHLPENCLLVANNSRVIPARLFGTRPSGGKVEFLLLTPLPLLLQEGAAETFSIQGRPWKSARAEGLLRSSKAVRLRETIRLGPDMELTLWARGPYGRCAGDVRWSGDLASIVERDGVVPLPPYIKRVSGQEDKERYQTVYARQDKAGSVAAPTAGLHFTSSLRQRLTEAGHAWAEVTLHVGYGTFSPVRSQDIRRHPMHEEYVEVLPHAAKAVSQAKKEGRPVIAVGTTTARTLEGVLARSGKKAGAPLLEPYCGPVSAFLYPGRPFQVVDGLITNFHLPESSLLMLVAALAGREAVLRAYERAVSEGYRFFSYGDAMLIL